LGISRLKYQAGSGVLRYAVALPPPYAGFESECCLRIKANSTIENKGLWGHKPWRNFIPWFVSSQTNTIVATNHIQNLGMYVVKRFVGHKPWGRIFIPWFVSSQTNTIVPTNHI
jgi:hypothetical protein